MKPPAINPERLRFLRTQLSHVLDIDASMGLPPGTYAQAERGEYRFGPEELFRLRSLLRAQSDAGFIPTPHAGEQCRRWRESLAITQAEMARRYGCSQPRIYYLEHSPNIGLRSLARYAKGLGIPLARLIGNLPWSEPEDEFV